MRIKAQGSSFCKRNCVILKLSTRIRGVVSLSRMFHAEQTSVLGLMGSDPVIAKFFR
jgi:hypothetical protein